MSFMPTKERFGTPYQAGQEGGHFESAKLAEEVPNLWQFQQQEWHSAGANQREGEGEFQVQLPVEYA
jgi:hypothetical protein